MFWVITVSFNTVSLAKAGIQTISGSNIYKNKNKSSQIHRENSSTVERDHFL